MLDVQSIDTGFELTMPASLGATMMMFSISQAWHKVVIAIVFFCSKLHPGPKGKDR